MSSQEIDERIERLTAQAVELTNRFESQRAASKAAAIMSGAHSTSNGFDESPGWLKALADSRTDPVAAKAVLGTSGTTGTYIIPSNFVSGIVEFATLASPWRSILNVVTGVRGTGVNIPYESAAPTASLYQGGSVTSYGSNKSNMNFELSSATATFNTIATIIDVGNQLLRQSEGAAEALVRSRLGRSFALAESAAIILGTGANSTPLGFNQAFTTVANSSYSTALSSEPRAAAIGRGLGALESRGAPATAIVMNPGDFYETITEGLGTSYAGGWAVDPAVGPASSDAPLRLWGVPVYRDGQMTSGTAFVGAFNQIDLFIGSEYRIDVSSEAGTRFDQNLTGFRAEEDLAFNALGYVANGLVQKVTGL